MALYQYTHVCMYVNYETHFLMKVVQTKEDSGDQKYQ